MVLVIMFLRKNNRMQLMSKTTLVSLISGMFLVSSLGLSAIPSSSNTSGAQLPPALPDGSSGLIDLLGEGTTVAQVRRKRRRGSRARIPSRSRTRVPSRTRTRVPSRTRTRVPSRTKTRIPSRTRTRIPTRTRVPTRIPSRIPGVKAAFVQIAPNVVMKTSLTL